MSVFGAYLLQKSNCITMITMLLYLSINSNYSYLLLLFHHQSDCNCALQIDPCHIKSLLRRATAYNALGKHRAALRDLLRAAQLEPAKYV